MVTGRKTGFAAVVVMLLVAWVTPPMAFARAGAGQEPPSAQPDQVEVGIWVVDIDSIDSAGQRFVASVFLLLEWLDPTLAHAGPHPVRHPLEEIWNPAIQVSNQIGIVRRTLPEIVEVAPDGKATYRQLFVGSFTQPLDFTDFPFDQHVFSLHFVAIGHRPDELDFVPSKELMDQGLANAAGIAPELSLPDWDIIGWEAKSVPYVVTPQLAVAGYALEFTASRRAIYYVLKIILPLILIVLMSWAVFWIDTQNAGSKISVSVTAMLTLIAYRFAVSAHVPPVPYMTRLDRFIMASTVLVFLTLAEVIITSRLMQTERAGPALRIDKIARLLFPAGFIAFGASALL